MLSPTTENLGTNEVSPTASEMRPGRLGRHPLDARSSTDMMRAVAALLGGSLGDDPAARLVPDRAPGEGHPLALSTMRGGSDATTVSEGIPPPRSNRETDAQFPSALAPPGPMIPFRMSLSPPLLAGATSQQTAAPDPGVVAVQGAAAAAAPAAHPAAASQQARGQPVHRTGNAGSLPQRVAQAENRDPFMDGLVEWAVANLGNTVRIVALGGGAGAGGQLLQTQAAGATALTAEQFDQIPSEAWSATVAAAAAGVDADANCAICQSAYTDGDLTSVMPLCRHRFHTQCVRPWLRDRASTCPCCRQSVLQSAADAAATVAADPAVAEDTDGSHDTLLRSLTVD